MTARKPRHTKRMINPPRWYKSWEQVEAKAWDIAMNQNQQIRQVLMGESIACELSREAYEDAQMHSKTNHALLTEANAEIKKLKIELAGATGESWGYLVANGHLNDYIDELRAEVAQWRRIWSGDRKFWWDRYKKQQETITALTEANKALRESLDKYEKFNVRSKALG